MKTFTYHFSINYSHKRMGLWVREVAVVGHWHVVSTLIHTGYDVQNFIVILQQGRPNSNPFTSNIARHVRHNSEKLGEMSILLTVESQIPTEICLVRYFLNVSDKSQRYICTSSGWYQITTLYIERTPSENHKIAPIVSGYVTDTSRWFCDSLFKVNE